MRMNARSILFVSLFLSGYGMAQAPFPIMDGETANDRRVTVPDLGSGRCTLIGMAFGKAAAPLLEEWYEPAYLRFVAKHGLFASSLDCDVYFVPVFVGVNKAAYGATIRKFKKSAEPEIVDHVIFYNGSFDEIRTQLALDLDNIPYFFVLDPGGRIIHRSDGKFTDEKLEAIEEVLLERAR